MGLGTFRRHRVARLAAEALRAPEAERSAPAPVEPTEAELKRLTASAAAPDAGATPRRGRR
jgi:hypothetical protein